MKRSTKTLLAFGVVAVGGWLLYRKFFSGTVAAQMNSGSAPAAGSPAWMALLQKATSPALNPSSAFKPELIPGENYSLPADQQWAATHSINPYTGEEISM